MDRALEPQEYLLKSDGGTLTITGGSDIGLLYGHIGMRNCWACGSTCMGMWCRMSG